MSAKKSLANAYGLPEDKRLEYVNKKRLVCGLKTRFYLCYHGEGVIFVVSW